MSVSDTVASFRDSFQTLVKRFNGDLSRMAAVVALHSSETSDYTGTLDI
jgi:hypothetical protein